MEPRPPGKRLQLAPFTIQATRGLLRDQKLRRILMAISIAIAALMLVAGLSVLRPWLDPHEHPWRCVVFWLVCAWQTMLAILLALFDLLLVRAEARAARQAIRQQVADAAAQASERKPDDE